MTLRSNEEKNSNEMEVMENQAIFPIFQLFYTYSYTH